MCPDCYEKALVRSQSEIVLMQLSAEEFQGARHPYMAFRSDCLLPHHRVYASALSADICSSASTPRPIRCKTACDNDLARGLVEASLVDHIGFFGGSH